MQFCFVVLAIFAIPCFMATIWGKKPGETLLVSFVIMNIILFLFYCLDKLETGYIVLLILLGGSYFFSVFWIIWKRQKWGRVRRNFFSVGFVAACALIVIYRLFVSSFYPYLWDELRLWSALPKSLYVSSRLQLGSDALIFLPMQNYFPGLALLQYFFERIYGNYTEWIVYFVYAVLGCSLILLPIEKSDQLGKSRWLVAPVFVFFTFFFPLVFFHSTGIADGYIYYRSLFIDGLLGLAFAYSLYCGFESRQSSFDAVKYTASIVLLMLLKESGLLLSIFSLMFFLICNYKTGRNEQRTKNRKKNHIGITVFISVFCIILIKVSWQTVLAQHHVTAEGGWVLADLSQFHISADQISILKQYGNALLYEPLFAFGRIRFSWVGLIVIYTCILLFFRFFRVEGIRIKVLLGALLINCTYAVSMAVLFIHWNRLSSYVRYIETGIVAIYLVLFYHLFDVMICILNNNPKRIRAFRAAALVLICIAIPSKWMTYKWINNINTAKLSSIYLTEKENSSRVLLKIKDDCPGNEKKDFINIFYLNDGTVDHVINHHQMYNQLLTEGIIVRNWCYDTSLETDNQNISFALIQKLADCQYLYIGDIELPDSYLYNEQYYSFFGGSESIQNHQLYKIIINEEKTTIRFLPI